VPLARVVLRIPAIVNTPDRRIVNT